MTHEGKPGQSGSDELAGFLRENAGARFVDALVADIAGILRGTRLDLDGLRRVYTGGYWLPGAVFGMDAHGEIPVGTGLGDEEGYVDRLCRPIPDTLFPVPWLDFQAGQVQVTMFDLDGSPFYADPRHVLQSVVDRFRELDLIPCVAIEMEFCLIDAKAAAGYRVQPPRSPLTRRRLEHTQCNSMETLDEFTEFLNEVCEFCAIQGIPASTCIAEHGAGQFEINIEHVEDAAKACDIAVRFKRLVRATAKRHGLAATFMAAPTTQSPGNGMHIHVSLNDSERRNIFEPADSGDQLLRHCIAGTLATMSESMALFAPNPNSYRRLRSGEFISTEPNWGYNHRGAAVRVPPSTARNRRLEHRVAGADANPYLTVAAVLAGMHYGLSKKLDSPEPLTQVPASERPADRAGPSLTMDAAIQQLDSSKLLRDYLGPKFIDLYTHTRRWECSQFERQVSERDLSWYLSVH